MKLLHGLQSKLFSLKLLKISAGKFYSSQNIQATFILLGLAFIFLSTPILNYSKGYYLPSDVFQTIDITQVDSNYFPQNYILTDTPLVIIPWLVYDRHSLSSGRLPLWNPYNGNGMPQMANYQSALFSPFSLPYYFLSLRQALIVAVFLKIFSLGFFTYLYLKSIKLQHWAALAGAIAFMFNGNGMIWLNVVVYDAQIGLPLCLYFLEKIFSSTTNKPIFWGYLGIGFSLWLLLAAGNPEVFYFNIVLVVAYTLFKLIGFWNKLGYSWATARQIWGIVLRLFGSGLLAIGVHAIVLIPFLEYIANCSLLGGGRDDLLNRAYGPYRFYYTLFPNLIGTPLIKTLNWGYHETTSVYVGIGIIFMAILAGCLVNRNKYVRFFWASSLLWTVYVYDIFDMRKLFELIPGGSIVPFYRSQTIWGFSICCCAAIFVDYILQQASVSQTRRKNFYLLTGFGLVFLIGAANTALNFLPRYAADLSAKGLLKDSGILQAYVPQHITTQLILLVFSWLALLLLHFNFSKIIRLFLITILLGVIFSQTGLLFKDYYPTIENRFFYPKTQAIRQVHKIIGSELITNYKAWGLQGNMNMMYSINIPGSYDAMWVKYNSVLYREFFEAKPIENFVRKIDRTGLQIFGIKYIYGPKAQEELPVALPFEKITTFEHAGVYRYSDSLSRYWTVSRAWPAPSDQAALEHLKSANFNAAEEVVVSSPLTSQATSTSPIETTPVKVVQEKETSVLLTTSRSTGGYLVMAKTYYPGWKVTVNGQEKPLLRANYAFSAVELPSGDSTVEFYYDPLSVKIGSLLSLISLGIVISLTLIFSVRSLGTRHKPLLE